MATLSLLFQLERTQWWPADRLRDAQQAQLKRLLESRRAARAVLSAPPRQAGRCRRRGVLAGLARAAAADAPGRAAGRRRPRESRASRWTWRAHGSLHLGIDRQADPRRTQRPVAADVERGDGARASLARSRRRGKACRHPRIDRGQGALSRRRAPRKLGLLDRGHLQDRPVRQPQHHDTGRRPARMACPRGARLSADASDDARSPDSPQHRDRLAATQAAAGADDLGGPGPRPARALPRRVERAGRRHLQHARSGLSRPAVSGHRPLSPAVRDGAGRDPRPCRQALRAGRHRPGDRDTPA